MSDDWLPSFAKLTPKELEPEQDDPLKLGPNALSLEGLQAIYRNPALSLTTRFRAMVAAVPYETPKLLATAIVDGRDFATLLDERIKRFESMKSIEARPVEQPETKPQVETKPPLARTPDRRFRRI